MTSLTIGTALKELIETSGLNLKAYVDRAPDPDEPLPYCTVHEGISVTPDGRNDGGVGETVSELVQVDLWEQWTADDERPTDSPALVYDLMRMLHSANLPTAPNHVYGTIVQNRRRIFEPGRDRVHHAITLRVARQM